MVESREGHCEGVDDCFGEVEADDGHVDGDEEEEVAQGEKQDGEPHVRVAVHS